MAQRFLLVIIYLSFISIGLPDAVTGTAWPAVRLTFGQPLEALSAIVMAFTVSGALSGFFGSVVIKKFGTGIVAAASCLITSLALIGYAVSPSFVWLVVLTVPMGLGCGAVDSALNNFVSQHYTARHMNWLHGFWGVGVTLGPLVIGAALASSSGWRGGALTLGLMQLALALVLALSLSLWHKAPLAHAQATEAGHAARSQHSTHPLAVWIAPLTFFIYVAAEASVGVWMASILVGSRQFTPAQAGGWMSVYFGAIMVGRFAIGLVANHLGNRLLVRLGIGLSIVGVLLFMLNGPYALSMLALALIGLGFAPVYPSLMHETANRFAPDVARVVIGRQAGCSYVGAFFLPPLTGVIAGSVGLWVIMPAIAAMLVILLLVTQWLDRMTPAETEGLAVVN